MEEIDQKDEWAEKGARVTARILVLLWALGWMFFGFITGVGEGLGIKEIISHVSMPGLIFMLTALIAYKWEFMGGVMLLLEGAAAMVYFISQISRISFVGFYFVLYSGTLPAIFMGFLFLYSWRKSREYQTGQTGQITA